jgi:radical SAM superfamily enzyme YgiQ (UPF0313 family)
MRVLLIMPNYGLPQKAYKLWFYGHIFPPLGLEYIAANIEDIAEVRIIDNRLSSMNLVKVEKTIETFQPDYVGISCNFSTQAYVVSKIAGMAKAHGARTVVGGWHPTLSPSDTLDSPSVDVVVRGEGEATFKELIQKGHPAGIPGLSYKQDGKQIHNPDRDLMELAHVRLPARHLRSEEAKIAYNFYGFPVDCIEISRGCPYSCDFCCIHNFYRHRYRNRPIMDVINELHLKEIESRASIVFIVDDNFMVNPKYVVSLCDAIIKSGIKTFFKTQVRVDSVVEHPDVYKKMADAGFLFLFLGFESFSDRTLEKLNKRTKFEQIKESIKILHDLGYIIQGNVILGADLDDTKQDLESSISIAKSLDIDMLSFTLLTCFPGTKLMERVVREGRLISKDWRDFNWLTPTIKYPNLTSDDLKYYLAKAHDEVPFFDKPMKRIGNIIQARGWKFLLPRITQMNQIRMIPQALRSMPSFSRGTL